MGGSTLMVLLYTKMEVDAYIHGCLFLMGACIIAMPTINVVVNVYSDSFIPLGLSLVKRPPLTPSSGQALIFRDVWLLIVQSAAFELLEYTFRDQLPVFGENTWAE